MFYADIGTVQSAEQQFSRNLAEIFKLRQRKNRSVIKEPVRPVQISAVGNLNQDTKKQSAYAENVHLLRGELLESNHKSDLRFRYAGNNDYFERCTV